MHGDIPSDAEPTQANAWVVLIGVSVTCNDPRAVTAWESH